MKLSINFLLTTAILFFSCESKMDKLKGHWHSIGQQPTANEYYWTLDIDDSISIINKYCVDGMIYETLPIKFEGDVILPILYPDYSSNISIEQDTLIIDSEFKYYKLDSKICLEKDVFCNLRLSVNLKSNTLKSLPFYSLKLQNLSFINVGGIKPEFKDLYKIQNDSILIQVGDVFIGLEHIEKFVILENEKHAFYEQGKQRILNEKFQLVINADSVVPQYFMDSVLNRVYNVLPQNQVLVTSFNKKKNRLEYEGS